jgi:hypothetical protein
MIFNFKSKNVFISGATHVTAKWNNQNFKKRWPTRSPLLSKRDNLEK